MKHAIVAASILLALAGRASAQPGMTPAVPASDVADEPPARSPRPAPAPTWVPSEAYEGDPAAAYGREPAPAAYRGEPLSESTALSLSLGGTAVSWGLLIGSGLVHSSGVSELMALTGVAGVVYGPTLGHAYADRYFTRGLGLRLAGLGVAVAGAFVAFVEEPVTYGHDDPGPASDGAPVGTAIAIAGAVIFVAGTIDDIVTAPRRARQKNRERGLALGLAPVTAGRSLGLALGGRF